MRVFSTDQPHLETRADNVSSAIPVSRAHCAMVNVFPLNVQKVLFDLLLACSTRVAQKQFSGEYGPSKSFRSIECADVGLGPISAKNASNDRHRSATFIPRPPYRGYDFVFWFPHLVCMLVQILCSGLPLKLCRVFLSLADSRTVQWHPRDLETFKFPVLIKNSLPHRHLHKNPFFPLWLVAARKTVNASFIELSIPKTGSEVYG